MKDARVPKAPQPSVIRSLSEIQSRRKYGLWTSGAYMLVFEMIAEGRALIWTDMTLEPAMTHTIEPSDRDFLRRVMLTQAIVHVPVLFPAAAVALDFDKTITDVHTRGNPTQTVYQYVTNLHDLKVLEKALEKLNAMDVAVFVTTRALQTRVVTSLASALAPYLGTPTAQGVWGAASEAEVMDNDLWPATKTRMLESIATEALGGDRRRLTLFDDGAEFVADARRAGFGGVQVVGPRALAAALNTLPSPEPRFPLLTSGGRRVRRFRRSRRSRSRRSRSRSRRSRSRSRSHHRRRPRRRYSHA